MGKVEASLLAILFSIGAYAQVDPSSFERVGAMGLLGLVLWFVLNRQNQLLEKVAEKLEEVAKRLDKLNSR
jgi:hypothetical protein